MSMSQAKIDAFERTALRGDLPDFRVGDTIAVHYKIKRHRAGARSTITVRKTSFSVGVERTFPLHSPRLEKIDVESRGIVRKARLFFLRGLEGKAARVRDEKDR
jgi:large subunit ribosomal protein L19